MRRKSIVFIGVDEVGRGAWAGPITAAAATFHKMPDKKMFSLIRSSKLISESNREFLANKLRKYVTFSLSSVSPETIDKIGIQNANKIIFLRSVRSLVKKIKKFNQSDIVIKILADGRKICSFPHDTIFMVGGDERSKIISAASIIAKVSRDSAMRALHKIDSNYFFDENKGYGTIKHQKALKIKGISQWHRKSYKPIQETLSLFDKKSIT